MSITFWGQWLKSSQILIAAVMMLAFVTLPIAPSWGQESHPYSAVRRRSLRMTVGQSKDEANSNSSVIPNGIYLYGQSQKPDQIGKEYIVFKAEGGELVGALYMPRSEFSCFRGEIAANQLQMIVDHPYEDSTHPYAIALTTRDAIASRQNDSLSQPVTLQGYHPIEDISDNDRRLLAICQSAMNN